MFVKLENDIVVILGRQVILQVAIKGDFVACDLTVAVCTGHAISDCQVGRSVATAHCHLAGAINIIPICIGSNLNRVRSSCGRSETDADCSARAAREL